jgi:DNA-binding NarL/FixJ family response regulator
LRAFLWPTKDPRTKNSTTIAPFKQPPNAASTTVKILVVDDHALVREGLRQVLKGLGEDTEVVQAGSCTHALEQLQDEPNLDLILLDFHLPDSHGLDALAALGQRHPEVPVIVMSGIASAQNTRRSLEAGAAGFVSKSSLCEELLSAVRLVLGGGIYFPRELQGDLRSLPPTTAHAKPPLTQRQERVLRGLRDGLSNREIAELLHLSEETVKSHVAAILRYFEVQNRTQAVVAAGRMGYDPVA